jgi:hypothetical protein
MSLGKLSGLPCLWFLVLCFLLVRQKHITTPYLWVIWKLCRWFSWLVCPHPCTNSVIVNMEIYGGIKPFVLLLTKPSTWLAHLLPPHSCPLSCIEPCVWKISWEMANPKFSKGIVRALFGHGFLLCEDEKHFKPTHSLGNTLCKKKLFGISGNVAKILLRYNLLCFVFKCKEHLCMNYVCFK